MTTRPVPEEEEEEKEKEEEEEEAEKEEEEARKEKEEARQEADKEADKDERETQGFKISPDTTVVEGYRDPGFTLKGVQGRSLLGPIGAAVTPFFPVTGQAIGAVGSLTGY